MTELVSGRWASTASETVVTEAGVANGLPRKGTLTRTAGKTRWSVWSPPRAEPVRRSSDPDGEAWWVPLAMFGRPSFERMDTLSSRGAQQVGQLSAGGPDPFTWAIGELALLPAAASA